MKILVVEDHPKLRENIMYFLELKWNICDWVINWLEAFDAIKQRKYDVIILDINMPIMNGREFIKKIRDIWDDTPTIALTSNSLLDDKLEIFWLWVDDYLTKPFELAELEVRIKALSKRKEKTFDEYIFFWDFQLDLTRKKIIKKNKPVDLTNKEFLILEFLARNLGYPKTKTEIISYVWGEDAAQALESITLEAHLSYLRKKLGKKVIKTLKWIGYVIEK